MRSLDFVVRSEISSFTSSFLVLAFHVDWFVVLFVLLLALQSLTFYFFLYLFFGSACMILLLVAWFS